MRSGNKPIDGLKKELLALCRSDSLSEDGLREIITERYGAIKYPNITDYAFFSWACNNEKVTEGILRLLLEYFPDAASFLSPLGNGNTPLHYMCFNKNVTLGMVKLLIDAYPESLSRANNDGWMPLYFLCLNKNLNEDAALDILKLLIERCPESVRHPADNGDLPIHFAAMNQSPEFCRSLIEAYPGSERMTNNNGALLPIHWACLFNTVATVKYLYKLYPESISVANNNGKYPIHSVIWGLKKRSNPEAAVEVIQFLLDCNTDVATQKDQDEFPLYWVCKRAKNGNTPKLNAYLKVLHLLYDAYPEAIDEVASNFGSFSQEVQAFINTQLTYARQARDHSLMHLPDESGQLPLHIALRDNATLGSIKLLVKGNPSAVQTLDNSGILPLHLACQHHHSPSVVEYLVGVSSLAVKMKDLCQNTLLHFACRGANHAVITFLLEKYDAAFVSTRNSHKQLPIDLLFDSEALSDREGIKYMESIYRLIRANPETLMGCDLNMNERQQAQSEIGKKRKVDDMN